MCNYFFIKMQMRASYTISICMYMLLNVKYDVRHKYLKTKSYIYFFIYKSFENWKKKEEFYRKEIEKERILDKYTAW